MVKDINHIVICETVVNIFINDGTFTHISLFMDEIKSHLNPDIFFCTSHPYIYSYRILYIYNYFNGRLALRLKGYNNDPVIISRDKVSKLRAYIDR